MSYSSCKVCTSNKVSLYCTKKTYQVWRCHDCKSYFTNFGIEKELLESTYNEGYYRGGNHVGGFVDYNLDKQVSLHYWQDVLTKLARLTQKGLLLDVGAASGLFVKMALDNGWGADGVEVSKAAIALAELNGVKVVHSDYKAALRQSSYDVITMFDVIEHVDNPKLFVSEYSVFLKQGGVLVINTPNNNSLWARLTGVRWNAINPPEHAVLLNTNSLKLLLDECGFYLCFLLVPSKKFRFSYVLHTLGRVSGLNFFNEIGKSICNSKLDIPIPLNLRDNVLVFAKKI